MTALASRLLVLFTAGLVALPGLATVVGLGPMGHYSGSALLVRVVVVFAASASLATAFGIAGYLYWLHVILPASPATVRVALPHDLDLRRRQPRDGSRRLAAVVR